MDASLETIYNDFHARLQAFILGRVSDHQAAEDILQDVFLKIHAHIGDLRASDRLESWIYQITRNAITDYYRRSRPQDELTESIAAPQEEEPDASAELAASVREMLRCIPLKYRQALEMTEFQGLTQIELADKLHISVSGAKSRVQRGREKLKQAFLDCCHFEFDRFGGVISYQPNCIQCSDNQSRSDCETQD